MKIRQIQCHFPMKPPGGGILSTTATFYTDADFKLEETAHGVMLTRGKECMLASWSNVLGVWYRVDGEEIVRPVVQSGVATGQSATAKTK